MEDLMGQQKPAYVQPVRQDLPDFRLFQEFLCLFHRIHVDAYGVRNPVFGKEHPVRLLRIGGIGHLHAHGLCYHLRIGAFVLLHHLSGIFLPAGQGLLHPAAALLIRKFSI